MPARVVADGPLAADILELAGDRVEWLPWQVALEGGDQPVDASTRLGVFRNTGCTARGVLNSWLTSSA